MFMYVNSIKWGASVYFKRHSCLKECPFPRTTINLMVTLYSTRRNTLLFLACFLLGSNFLLAQKVEKLEQVANGQAQSPDLIVDFITGNVNETKSHFAECMSIPYHLEMLSLNVGETYCVILGYDTKRSSTHAIDFLTSWDVDIAGGHEEIFGHQHDPSITPEMINPLLNTTLDGLGITETRYTLPTPNFPGAAASGFTIDPVVYYDTAVVAKGFNEISVWNGSIVGTPCIVAEENLGGASAEAGVEVCFQLDPGATQNSLVLAWGGHISTQVVWGEGNSATSIAGSPYHMFVPKCNGDVYLNGINGQCAAPTIPTGNLVGCGNKEVQLSVRAVQAPGECFLAGVNPICGNDEALYAAFLFDGVGTIEQVEWTISQDTDNSNATFTSTGTKTFTDNTAPFEVPILPGGTGTFILSAEITYEPADGGPSETTQCVELVTVLDNPSVAVISAVAEACVDDDLIDITGTPAPTPEPDGDLGGFLPYR